MRLLHVLAETGWSGGEEQLAYLVRHLASKGHHNEFALAPDSQFAEFARSTGAAVHSVNLRRPVRDRGYWLLRRAALSARPDLVHFGCSRSMLWGGVSLRACKDVVKVTTRRIDYPISRALWTGGRYRLLVDHVIANCHAVHRRILAAGVAPERVSVIHEGIESTRFVTNGQMRAAARARLGIPADARVVSCAAVLRPRKGQRVLLDAFERVLDKVHDAVLILAGTGDDEAAIRARLASCERLGRAVILLGELRPIQDLYAASDVFAMASWHEGLSNACLEAAAAGLPLVVTDVGGLPEIVEPGVTGYIAPPGDVATFAEKLTALLADEDLRRRSGEAGRRRVERLYTAERMATATEELFERLIEARSRERVAPASE